MRQSGTLIVELQSFATLLPMSSSRLAFQTLSLQSSASSSATVTAQSKKSVEGPGNGRWVLELGALYWLPNTLFKTLTHKTSSNGTIFRPRQFRAPCCALHGFMVLQTVVVEKIGPLEDVL